MDAASWCRVVAPRRLPRGLLNDGLHPVSEAARISFSGNKPVVTDGSFSEAKEVVRGYCIIEVKSKSDPMGRLGPLSGGKRCGKRRLAQSQSKAPRTIKKTDLILAVETIAAAIWPPHLMFYYSQTDPATWGAGLPDSPVLASNDTGERLTTFAVAVPRWSDGTEVR